MALRQAQTQKLSPQLKQKQEAYLETVVKQLLHILPIPQALTGDGDHIVIHLDRESKLSKVQELLQPIIINVYLQYVERYKPKNKEIWENIKKEVEGMLYGKKSFRATLTLSCIYMSASNDHQRYIEDDRSLWLLTTSELYMFLLYFQNMIIDHKRIKTPQEKKHYEEIMKEYKLFLEFMIQQAPVQDGQKQSLYEVYTQIYEATQIGQVFDAIILQYQNSDKTIKEMRSELLDSEIPTLSTKVQKRTLSFLAKEYGDVPLYELCEKHGLHQIRYAYISGYYYQLLLNHVAVVYPFESDEFNTLSGVMKRGLLYRQRQNDGSDYFLTNIAYTGKSKDKVTDAYQDIKNTLFTEYVHILDSLRRSWEKNRLRQNPYYIELLSICSDNPHIREHIPFLQAVDKKDRNSIGEKIDKFTELFSYFVKHREQARSRTREDYMSGSDNITQYTSKSEEMKELLEYFGVFFITRNRNLADWYTAVESWKGRVEGSTVDVSDVLKQYHALLQKQKQLPGSPRNKEEADTCRMLSSLGLLQPDENHSETLSVGSIQRVIGTKLLELLMTPAGTYAYAGKPPQMKLADYYFTPTPYAYTELPGIYSWFEDQRKYIPPSNEETISLNIVNQSTIDEAFDLIQNTAIQISSWLGTIESYYITTYGYNEQKCKQLEPIFTLLKNKGQNLQNYIDSEKESIGDYIMSIHILLTNSMFLIEHFSPHVDLKDETLYQAIQSFYVDTFQRLWYLDRSMLDFRFAHFSKKSEYFEKLGLSFATLSEELEQKYNSPKLPSKLYMDIIALIWTSIKLHGRFDVDQQFKDGFIRFTKPEGSIKGNPFVDTLRDSIVTNNSNKYGKDLFIKGTGVFREGNKIRIDGNLFPATSLDVDKLLNSFPNISKITILHFTGKITLNYLREEDISLTLNGCTLVTGSSMLFQGNGSKNIIFTNVECHASNLLTFDDYCQVSITFTNVTFPKKQGTDTQEYIEKTYDMKCFETSLNEPDTIFLSNVKNFCIFVSWNYLDNIMHFYLPAGNDNVTGGSVILMSGYDLEDSDRTGVIESPLTLDPTYVSVSSSEDKGIYKYDFDFLSLRQQRIQEFYNSISLLDTGNTQKTSIYSSLMMVYNPEHEQALDSIAKLIGEHSNRFQKGEMLSVFEGGLGDGRGTRKYLEELSQLGKSFKYKGCDISTSMLTTAKEILSEYINSSNSTLHEQSIIDANVGGYDTYIFSLSLHNLANEQKEQVLSDICDNMTERTIIIIYDRMRIEEYADATKERYERVERLENESGNKPVTAILSKNDLNVSFGELHEEIKQKEKNGDNFVPVEYYQGLAMKYGCTCEVIDSFNQHDMYKLLKIKKN